MAKRAIATIRWKKSTGCWVCSEERLEATRKSYLVREVAGLVRERWERAGELGQLRVYGKGGRIQHERTYGRDPRRFPG